MKKISLKLFISISIITIIVFNVSLVVDKINNKSITSIELQLKQALAETEGNCPAPYVAGYQDTWETGYAYYTYEYGPEYYCIEHESLFRASVGGPTCGTDGYNFFYDTCSPA